MSRKLSASCCTAEVGGGFTSGPGLGGGWPPFDPFDGVGLDGGGGGGGLATDCGVWG